MAKTHEPMTPIALADLVGLLTMRQSGISLRPFMLKTLCDHMPQGVLDHAEPVADPVDGSLAIKVTLRSLRPERLHKEDREGDNSPARPRVRYWEPEAVAVIRMALANGGTMFMDDNCEGKTAWDIEGKWHYPEIFAEGIIINRVFMDAAPGDRVRPIVDRSHPWGHRDSRRRHLFIEPGHSRAKRGVVDFLDCAVEAFTKPNRGLTGPQRFEIVPENYRQILKDALALHAACNPSASPERVTAYLTRRQED